MNGHQKQREESRKMIETGLFELMREKDFDKITVSEIAERSDVARRTFYRLYKSKEDVICQHFGKLCQDYKNRYPALEGYNIRQISKEYFCFWHQHREFLLLLHKCGLDRMLYYEMSRVSSAVIKARIGCETLKRETGLEYFADYSAGGFINLLYSWILSGMKEDPEEYGEKVSEALVTVIYGHIPGQIR